MDSSRRRNRIDFEGRMRVGARQEWKDQVWMGGDMRLRKGMQRDSYN